MYSTICYICNRMLQIDLYVLLARECWGVGLDKKSYGYTKLHYRINRLIRITIITIIMRKTYTPLYKRLRMLTLIYGFSMPIIIYSMNTLNLFAYGYVMIIYPALIYLDAKYNIAGGYDE